jgi:hypothetical protein
MTTAAHLGILARASLDAVSIVEIARNSIPGPDRNRAIPHRFQQPIDGLRVRNVGRNIVKAGIDCHGGDAH